VLAVVISADGTPEALREPGCPLASFTYPESAARALGLAAERAEWLRQPSGSFPELDGVEPEAARQVVEAALAGSTETWLEPAATRRLLRAYGIPLVPERTATTVNEAVDAASALGFPVVVKSAAAGAHKTESGGVALDLRDPEQVRAAVQRIGLPVLVQRFVKGGAELLAGLVQDPMFGPLVAFGPGGVLAELIGDAGFRIAPLTDAEARDLVLSGKAGKLVGGFRGTPAADEDALVDLLLRLARLADDLPEVAELDLNPVVGLPDGCLAVDSRVRLRARPHIRPLKSW
jgi:acyl-CoA synthetase (NDP forming)